MFWNFGCDESKPIELKLVPEPAGVIAIKFPLFKSLINK
jgi:hypothetical protein